MVLEKTKKAFSVSSIEDKGLQALNDYLCNFKPEAALAMLRQFNSFKYNKEKVKNLNLPSWVFDKRVVPEWFSDYCCQQVLILGSDLFGKEMVLDDIKKIASFIIETDDPLCTSAEGVPATIRRIKNLQFSYQEPTSTFLARCHRMLKILELGVPGEYDYKKRFKEITGLEPELFFGLIIATYGHLTFKPELNGVPENWFFSEHLLKKVTKEEVSAFLQFVSNDIENFKKDFNILTNKSITNLSEDIFYKVHNLVPLVFRKKPFYKTASGVYMCPCPKLTEMFFSECLAWLLVKEDKDKFSKWFGDAFEAYCRSITPVSTDNFEVFFETEYMQGIEGPADIIVIIGDTAILFECKLRSFPDSAFITGMKVKNQWGEIEKDRDKILEKIFEHLERIKSNSTLLTEKFKKIKNIYPIRVTYEQLYDVNTDYKIYFEEAGNNKSSVISILTISTREYEMLMETLEHDHTLFLKTIIRLFKVESFYMYKDEKGDNTLAAEVLQIIVDETKINYEGTKRYHHLEDFFKNDFMKKAKELMFEIK